jgi:phosphatidylserine decarboxylase
MTIRAAIVKIVQQEDLNFLLSNRIPRRLATRFMGWFSRIEQPLVRDVSIRVWRLFSDLDLSDAEQTRFRSMHDCFTRRLKDGARPIDADPAMLVSPCDAIVGAMGIVRDGQVLQVKGFPYRLDDLLGDADHAARFAGGIYVTLRLTAGMYHRFHAPHDCHVGSVTHIAGDTWNVNPVALKRIERLFCKNERAAIHTTLTAGGNSVTLVAVAAILVASSTCRSTARAPRARPSPLMRSSRRATKWAGSSMARRFWCSRLPAFPFAAACARASRSAPGGP